MDAHDLRPLTKRQLYLPEYLYFGGQFHSMLGLYVCISKFSSLVLADMTNIKAEIPTIDIQPWLSGTNPDLVVDQVRAACQTYGFFQLVGHDIPLEMQQSILDCAKKFFSLPLDQKSLLKKDPVTGRGYEGFGSQSLQATTTTDRKEVSTHPM